MQQLDLLCIIHAPVTLLFNLDMQDASLRARLRPSYFARGPCGVHHVWRRRFPHRHTQQKAKSNETSNQNLS